MHELGITQNIVAIALEHAQDARVQCITLEIGKLSAIMPDAIQFCFDICAQGTPLAGARLEITEVPGMARCHQCGEMVPLELPFGVCECGSTNLEVIQGQELKIKKLELEAVCV